MGKVKRKDLILYLLYANKLQPLSGRTRLQKMFFLLEKEQKLASHLTSTFEFQPWKYGPFSAELLKDIEFLENVGLLKCRRVGLPVEPEKIEQENLNLDYVDDGSEYSSEQLYRQDEFSLSERGVEFVELKVKIRLPVEVRSAVETVKKQYGRLGLSSLLRYVYAKYPRYAAKSEIRDEL